MPNHPNPFRKLASVITSESQKRADQALQGKTMELGLITSTGLKLDSFNHEITQYLVADYLTLDATHMTETDAPTAYPVNTPPALKPLVEGDRVLVAPVSGGHQFVVIARVVNP